MKILTIMTTLMFWNVAMANGLTSLVQLEDGRTIISDAKGKTVYTFDKDEENISNCHGPCLGIWPPILVPEEATLLAPFDVIRTQEGVRQLTLNGKPLYHFFKDQSPTDILGDGIKNVWHIVIAELN